MSDYRDQLDGGCPSGDCRRRRGRRVRPSLGGVDAAGRAHPDPLDRADRVSRPFRDLDPSVAQCQPFAAARPARNSAGRFRPHRVPGRADRLDGRRERADHGHPRRWALVGSPAVRAVDGYGDRLRRSDERVGDLRWGTPPNDRRGQDLGHLEHGAALDRPVPHSRERLGSPGDGCQSTHPRSSGEDGRRGSDMERALPDPRGELGVLRRPDARMGGGPVGRRRLALPDRGRGSGLDRDGDRAAGGRSGRVRRDGAATNPYPGPLAAFDGLRADLVTWCPPCGGDLPYVSLEWSDDGGATWADPTIVGSNKPGEPLGISFLDQSRGWILLRELQTGTARVVMRTTDGGQTWETP